jgi:hypothetical protein
MKNWPKIRIGLFFWAALSLVACAEDEDLPIPSDQRDPYLGTWDVNENTGFGAPQFYTINISTGGADDEIVLEGLYNLTATRVVAIVDGTQLSIPQQNTAGIIFQGSGQANADFDQIALSFSADDGAISDNVEAVLRR